MAVFGVGLYEQERSVWLSVQFLSVMPRIDVAFEKKATSPINRNRNKFKRCLDSEVLQFGVGLGNRSG